MTTIDNLEFKRLEIQAQLDAGRTAAARNELGQFSTPSDLASDILTYVKGLLPLHTPVRFLDPAFGTGSFFSALLRTFPQAEIAAALGYEIDRHYGQAAEKLWGNTILDLRLVDFTRAVWPASQNEKSNLLICNPPYVRHHHIRKEEKQRLRGLVEQTTGIRLSGLSGLYCYFLCLSHNWLTQNGLAGWLIPSEFMDVAYGQRVKQYLLDRVTLLRIHRFNPNEVQFGDALVSSTVVWFRNALPPTEYSVEFSYGGSLLRPNHHRLVPSDTLRNTTKWTHFPLSHGSSKANGAGHKLSDLFTVKRGLATGANSFFLLTPEQAAQQQIPSQFLVPILPSPRYVFDGEIGADSAGHPILEKKLMLLNCRLGEPEIKASFPTLWRYLQRGVETGVSERYLCKRRHPWYSQEVRPPCPFLCTYMGRQGTKKGDLFRFFLNRSQATAPNVYLLLYPKPPLAEALRDNPGLFRAIWQTLNQIPLTTLVSEGRVYGGGLYKMEPSELGNAPAKELFRLLPKLNYQLSFGQMAGPGI